VSLIEQGLPGVQRFGKTSNWSQHKGDQVDVSDVRGGAQGLLRKNGRGGKKKVGGEV